MADEKDTPKGSTVPAGEPPEPKSKPKAKAPVPRVCREDDRAAGTGLKRYRVRCVGTTSGGAVRPVGLYVLAADVGSAEQCYLEAERSELQAMGYGADQRPVLHTDELPD